MFCLYLYRVNTNPYIFNCLVEARVIREALIIIEKKALRTFQREITSEAHLTQPFQKWDFEVLAMGRSDTNGSLLFAFFKFKRPNICS